MFAPWWRRNNASSARLFFFVLVIKFPALTREADTAHKVSKARIGAEGIESWSQEDTRIKSLFVAFFEPIHGLIRITESRIDHGDLRTVRVNRV
jgi:hypothetical protein